MPFLLIIPLMVWTLSGGQTRLRLWRHELECKALYPCFQAQFLCLDRPYGFLAHAYSFTGPSEESTNPAAQIPAHALFPRLKGYKRAQLIRSLAKQLPRPLRDPILQILTPKQ